MPAANRPAGGGSLRSRHEGFCSHSPPFDFGGVNAAKVVQGGKPLRGNHCSFSPSPLPSPLPSGKGKRGVVASGHLPGPGLLWRQQLRCHSDLGFPLLPFPATPPREAGPSLRLVTRRRQRHSFSLSSLLSFWLSFWLSIFHSFLLARNTEICPEILQPLFHVILLAFLLIDRVAFISEFNITIFHD
jgi:hypothetical protein